MSTTNDSNEEGEGTSPAEREAGELIDRELEAAVGGASENLPDPNRPTQIYQTPDAPVLGRMRRTQ